MDSSSTAAVITATASEGTDVLDVEDDFVNVYDVPFIVINKVDGKYIAEVETSDDDLVTQARIEEALAVARTYGQHSYARKHGDIGYPELAGLFHGVITIAFTPDTDGGL